MTATVLGARRRIGPLAELARTRAALSVVDVAIVAGFAVLGAVARRGGLPQDGLWYDDAWVAAGAAKGSPAQLFTVSTNHPGFTAMLMGWIHVVSPRTEIMAWPALLIGLATAPLVYLFLARIDIHRAVAVVVAALVLVAPADVQFSGRVKSYVFEVLIILGLSALVPRLAHRRWSWSTVGLWVAGAVLLGTFSVFSLLATVVAIAILVLHPLSDRRRRMLALGAQGVVQGVYFAIVQRSYNTIQMGNDWERVYNGYIELEANPVTMARQVGSHISRVGQALVHGGPAITVTVVLVATAGLAITSLRGPRTIMARYLLTLIVVAFLGAVARVVPFGASNEQLLSPGSRATLWLFPSLLVGLAFTVDGILRLVRARRAALALPLLVVLIALAGVVSARSFDRALLYPLSGSRSAHEFIERELTADQPVFMFANGIFPYAAEPGVPVEIVPAPETLNSFRPRITDGRVWVLGYPVWDGSTAAVARRVGDAQRVAVHDGLPGFGDQQKPALERVLRSLGFQRVRKELFGGSVGVDLWERRSANRTSG